MQNLQQNVRNGLKTSVRKVVQQFKSSIDSAASLASAENEVENKFTWHWDNIAFTLTVLCLSVLLVLTSILSWQMGFPYELFTELYCYDKVELYPFGLVNCGNRCCRVLLAFYFWYIFMFRKGVRGWRKGEW